MGAPKRSGWVDRPTDRRDTLPPDWFRLRTRCLKRDNYRCQHVRYDTGRKCGERANQADHIGDRANHALENLQSLCWYHHQQKTSAQGGNAAAANRKRRPEQRHPGLLR